MMRIFVAGSTGQVATALAEMATVRQMELKTFGRPDFDLETHRGAEIIDAFAPDVIINASGYTAVDKAEAEPDKAFAINCDGVGWLASLAARRSVPFLHISTDYVFNGSKPIPYIESDPTGPICTYGRSKLAGEERALAVYPATMVLRTAWVYSPFGLNFVKTILRLAQERDNLRVVDDQIGNPTSAHDLAEALLTVAERLQFHSGQEVAGIFHLAGSGETTWYGFAREVMRLAAEFGLRTVPIAAITSADYPTPAKRPANSRLDCTKFAGRFGLRLPNWQDGLSATMKYLVSSYRTMKVREASR